MKDSNEAATVSVLVVEDDPPTAHALELLLRHYKYEVTMTRTVAEALDRLSEQEPDVVLLDIMLPDGDGTRVLQAIRERRLRTRVTVLTGIGDLDRLTTLRRLRPDALLQKPVDFLQILEQLPRVA